MHKRSNPNCEALAGEQAGRVLSRERRINYRAPTGSDSLEGNMVWCDMRVPNQLCAVRDPSHAWKHSVRESGEPAFAQLRDGRLGCIGKSKDASQ